MYLFKYKQVAVTRLTTSVSVTLAGKALAVNIQTVQVNLTVLTTDVVIIVQHPIHLSAAVMMDGSV